MHVLKHTSGSLFLESQGAMWTARNVVASEGIRGLYAGFGTVICGMVPARLVRGVP